MPRLGNMALTPQCMGRTILKMTFFKIWNSSLTGCFVFLFTNYSSPGSLRAIKRTRTQAVLPARKRALKQVQYWWAHTECTESNSDSTENWLGRENGLDRKEPRVTEILGQILRDVSSAPLPEKLSFRLSPQSLARSHTHCGCLSF